MKVIFFVDLVDLVRFDDLSDFVNLGGRSESTLVSILLTSSNPSIGFVGLVNLVDFVNLVVNG